MSTTSEELPRAAFRLTEKLYVATYKAESRLDKGRRETLVETLFMSGDEREEFRVKVAERVAKLAGAKHSAVETSHLVAELRAALIDIVGMPVWVIFWLLD